MTAMPTLAPRIGQLTAFKALGLLLIAVFALLLPVLAPDSATTFSAVQINSANEMSGCSNPLTYWEGNIAIAPGAGGGSGSEGEGGGQTSDTA